MTNELSHSIRTLREMIARGEISAVSVCEAVRRQIDEKNPVIHALTHVLASSASDEAVATHNKRRAGTPLGKLAGIPVAIKDNIDTVPAVCAAGLDFLSAYRPELDAEVVQRLRGEDAVIVGVAATDSGAFGVVTPAVVNPAYPEKIAGGSSGGPAAAVAAGFCKAAIGTDTGGSIRIPAACCGIVGLKPTRGRVSARGVRPLAASVDHVGPLARSVDDIRAVMEVIDPGLNELPSESRKHSPIIGVPWSYFADAAPQVMNAIREAIIRCKELGCGVRDVEIPTPDEIIPSHLVLSLSEAALFHTDTSSEELDAHPQAARDGILLGRSYSSSQYLRARQQQQGFVERINGVLGRVDFLMVPTLPIEVPDRGVSTVMIDGIETGILQALIRYTAAFDQTGHPALSLPWHSSKLKMPGSLQFVGSSNSDNRLLDFVERFEQMAGAPARPDARLSLIHK
jgi:Asp-tRNA(Asn)/Glu-tRNA(Gln) amidotransferase A subunit family amidase